MSRINLNLNANLKAFKDFAVLADSEQAGKAVAMSAVGKDEAELGKFTVSKSTVVSRGEHDRVHFWGRTPAMKAANNKTRRDFFDAVVAQFGGDPRNIPATVKEAMLLKDSGLDGDNLGATDDAFKTGKPLSARRIDAVLTEIEKVLSKKRGPVAFASFYEEMTGTSDVEITSHFEVSLEDALKEMLAARFEGLNPGREVAIVKEIRKTASAMAALLGESPKAFKLHKDMEPLLKALCEKICQYFDTKAEKALVKASFKGFIDSLTLERRMDEKIAEVFAKSYKVEVYQGKGRPPKERSLPSVVEEDQKLASLKAELAKLETQNPQDDTQIKGKKKEIQDLEISLRKLGNDRTKAMDCAIKELLNDKEFCSWAAKKDFGLKTRDDLDAVGKFDTEAPSKGKETFQTETGSTSEVFEKFHKANPDKKVCVHVYGDRTFPLCGLLWHWNTQEEAAVRDADVKTLAHLVGKGLIKPSKKSPDRYEFATGKMDSIRGFTIKSTMQFARQVKNARPATMTFLFSSMPSMTKDSSSLDAEGDHDFLMECKNRYPAWNVKKSELPRARKFIAVFHQLMRADEKGELSPNKDTRVYTQEQFQMALLLLKFSGPNAHFNVFGKDSKREVMKLLDFVKNPAAQDDLDAILTRAEGNYATIVRKHIREWIIQARETGADVFEGGPIGCGVFGNDKKFVARILAEEFKANGGKMRFLYNTFADEKGGVRADSVETQTIFQNAFAEVGLADRVEVGEVE